MQKKIVSLVLLITLLFVLGGCGGTKATNPAPAPADSAAKAELIVGSAPGPASYPLAYMAQDNANLVVKPWKTYDQLLAMITAKQVNLSSTPITNAIIAYNKGFNVKLVNVSVWGMLYVISTDASIKDLSALKGKEIAVTGQGGIHDLVFRHLLIQQGINPDTDLRITYLDLPESSAKLISGEINYALLNEPNSSMATLNAKKTGKQLYRAIDLAQEWQKLPGQENNRIPQAGYIMMADTGLTDEAVSDFAASFATAAKWINEHPAEAGPLVEKQNEFMKAAAVTESLKYARLQPAMATDCRGEVEAFFGELTKTAPVQALGGKLPDAEFYFQK